MGWIGRHAYPNSPLFCSTLPLLYPTTLYSTLSYSALLNSLHISLTLLYPTIPYTKLSSLLLYPSPPYYSYTTIPSSPLISALLPYSPLSSLSSLLLYPTTTLPFPTQLQCTLSYSALLLSSFNLPYPFFPLFSLPYPTILHVISSILPYPTLSTTPTLQNPALLLFPLFYLTLTSSNSLLVYSTLPLLYPTALYYTLSYSALLS